MYSTVILLTLLTSVFSPRIPIINPNNPWEPDIGLNCMQFCATLYMLSKPWFKTRNLYTLQIPTNRQKINSKTIEALRIKFYLCPDKQIRIVMSITTVKGLMYRKWEINNSIQWHVAVQRLLVFPSMSCSIFLKPSLVWWWPQWSQYALQSSLVICALHFSQAYVMKKIYSLYIYKRRKSQKPERMIHIWHTKIYLDKIRLGFIAFT